MAKREFTRRYLTHHEFSLGPLQWRSSSMQEADESENLQSGSDLETTLQTFAERLQALIQQALREGCTSRELNTILGQHILGDHHVDA